MSSVFAKFIPAAWEFRYAATIHVATLAGGTPSDPNVAEGWLRSKMVDKDADIQEMIQEIMVERGVSAEQATRELDMRKHLNGFRRDQERNGELFIEGRQLKAGLKEAASVARAVGKLPDRWGLTRKGIVNFVAEHVQVVEERLYLGVTEPDRILQSFPKNARTGQTGIQYTEICTDVDFSCTIISDYEFSEKEWAMLWLTGEYQGIGASRSQSFGRYEVTRWDKLK